MRSAMRRINENLASWTVTWTVKIAPKVVAQCLRCMTSQHVLKSYFFGIRRSCLIGFVTERHWNQLLLFAWERASVRLLFTTKLLICTKFLKSRLYCLRNISVEQNRKSDNADFHTIIMFNAKKCVYSIFKLAVWFLRKLAYLYYLINQKLKPLLANTYYQLHMLDIHKRY